MKIVKTKLLAISLLTLTTAGILFYPTSQSIGAVTPPQLVPVQNLVNERPKVELVFVLDTTGSMGGLIQAAKEKIWSVATTMASAQPAPEIKIGLVAFRDRGDEYVTQVVDLSSDLDSMYATLMDFRANGGGDGPESVNQALYDAVHSISWSQDQSAYKVVFLVGDAPPHMDYQDEVQYPETVKVAQTKGIIINTIQAGQSGSTARQWQQIARLGEGDYFQVDQDGSALALSSPFDRQMAELSAKLDDTRLYYGRAEELKEKQRKLAATKKIHAKASLESRARRAAFNTSVSGAANLLGDKELVDDVASGRVSLKDIDSDMLPAPLQVMAPEEQLRMIEKAAVVRKKLKQEIQQLSDKRSVYLSKRVDELGAVKADSFDLKLFSTVKQQAEAKGMVYEAESPVY